MQIETVGMKQVNQAVISTNRYDLMELCICFG